MKKHFNLGEVSVQTEVKNVFMGGEENLASQSFTTKEGLADLQFLIVELEKTNPDPKVVKTLTSKYGIPYRADLSEQLDELLIYLNSLPPAPDLETSR